LGKRLRSTRTLMPEEEEDFFLRIEGMQTMFVEVVIFINM
jgi:hypothetical protein